MICKRCGTVFCVDNREDSYWLSPSHRSPYCSKICRKKSQPGRARTRKALRANPRKMRRAVRNLRERDGDDCWLCLLPIDFTITDPCDPMHCSRDHVVPRSLGGELTLANMRLAHRGCNTERGRRRVEIL